MGRRGVAPNGVAAAAGAAAAAAAASPPASSPPARPLPPRPRSDPRLPCDAVRSGLRWSDASSAAFSVSDDDSAPSSSSSSILWSSSASRIAAFTCTQRSAQRKSGMRAALSYGAARTSTQEPPRQSGRNSEGAPWPRRARALWMMSLASSSAPLSRRMRARRAAAATVSSCASPSSAERPPNASL